MAYWEPTLDTIKEDEMSIDPIDQKIQARACSLTGSVVSSVESILSLSDDDNDAVFLGSRGLVDKLCKNDFLKGEFHVILKHMHLEIGKQICIMEYTGPTR